ncbi:PE domain-containing protein [Mycobacterium sp.]|uniref:PE domain-containing protein n=1 Tax=Mycobacterium sp. TaxID=1785 RepID=UPI003F9C5D08
MSFVITRLEVPATAASHLNGVGSMTAAQNAAAATAATGLLPVAADELSALTATCFDAQADAVYETEAINTVAARQGGER